MVTCGKEPCPPFPISLTSTLIEADIITPELCPTVKKSGTLEFRALKKRDRQNAIVFLKSNDFHAFHMFIASRIFYLRDIHARVKP